jgi:hypothetical protein
MNTEIKAKWIAALRNRTYKKGIGRLNANGCFCVLGVLCDLATQEGICKAEERANGTFITYDLHSRSMPPSVEEWSELKDTLVAYCGEWKCLTELNDGGVGFLELSSLIEEQL